MQAYLQQKLSATVAGRSTALNFIGNFYIFKRHILPANALQLRDNENICIILKYHTKLT